MRLVSFAVWTGLLVLAVVFVGYSGRDDSHITYFVSDAIARGQGIVNYNGHAIEQASSPLFAMILAVPSAIFNVPTATFGPFVSVVFLIATAGLALWFFGRHDQPALFLLAFVAPPVVYWSASGMENSLYLFELTAFVLASHPGGEAASTERRTGLRRVLTGLLAFLLILTRPEAPFVLLAAIAITIVFASDRRSVLVNVLLPTLAGITAGFLLRIGAGYGLFPNPVLAKQSHVDLMARMDAAFGYFRGTFGHAPATSLVAAIAFVASSWRLLSRRGSDLIGRDRGVFMIAFVVGVAAFAFASGGDWMEMGRFLTVAYAFQLLLALLLFSRRATMVFAASMVVAFGVDYVRLVHAVYGGIPLFFRYDYQAENFRPSALEFRNMAHARDISFIDRAISALESDERPEFTFAAAQAGMVAYYLKHRFGAQLRFVDLQGLTTNEVLKCDRERWDDDPFQQIEALRSCIGMPLDYMFGLDYPDWRQLEAAKAAGCVELFRDETSIRTSPWKPALNSRQFLVRCE